MGYSLDSQYTADGPITRTNNKNSSRRTKWSYTWLQCRQQWARCVGGVTATGFTKNAISCCSFSFECFDLKNIATVKNTALDDIAVLHICGFILICRLDHN